MPSNVSVLMQMALIALAAGLATWNYVSNMDGMVLPHQAALYSVQPTRQNDRGLLVDATSSIGTQTDKFFSTLFGSTTESMGVSGKFDFHQLTPLMVSKQVLGCYGAAFFAADDVDMIDIRDGVTTDADNAKLQVTVKLNGWQRDQEETHALSVCTCIDSMYRNTLDMSRNTLENAHEFWANVYPTHIMNEPFMNQANKLTAAQVAAMRTARQTVYSKDIDQEIVEFCVTSSIPVHSVQYEGTLSLGVLMFAGQLCILLSMAHVWDHYSSVIQKAETVGSADNEYFQSQVVGGAKGEKMKVEDNHKVRRVASLAVAVFVFGLYVFIANSDKTFSSSTETEVSFRTATSTQVSFTPTGSFAVAALLVVLLVEGLFFYMHQSDIDDTEGKRYGRNSLTARVVERICTDVPAIVGFALLGMGVLMQAGVNNSSSVIGGALILVLAGFLQHISNLVELLYNAVCARLSSDVIVGLTLLDDEVNPQNRNENISQTPQIANQDVSENTRVRRILQYFGWTRLYIFMLVLFLSVTFFTVAKTTPYNYVIKNMLDGQLLYFVFAFLLGNIGFDMVFELLPYMFEKTNGDVMRLYFVVGYLIFFNANQLMYASSLHYAKSLTLT